MDNGLERKEGGGGYGKKNRFEKCIVYGILSFFNKCIKYGLFFIVKFMF